MGLVLQAIGRRCFAKPTSSFLSLPDLAPKPLSLTSPPDPRAHETASSRTPACFQPVCSPFAACGDSASLTAPAIPPRQKQNEGERRKAIQDMSFGLDWWIALRHRDGMPFLVQTDRTVPSIQARSGRPVTAVVATNGCQFWRPKRAQ